MTMFNSKASARIVDWTAARKGYDIHDRAHSEWWHIFNHPSRRENQACVLPWTVTCWRGQGGADRYLFLPSYVCFQLNWHLLRVIELVLIETSCNLEWIDDIVTYKMVKKSPCRAGTIDKCCLWSWRSATCFFQWGTCRLDSRQFELCREVSRAAAQEWSEQALAKHRWSQFTSDLCEGLPRDFKQSSWGVIDFCTQK